MRNQNIDRGWEFDYGIPGGFPDPTKESTKKIVDLPHDYMIASEVTKAAPAGGASGFFTEGVAFYTKHIMIPAKWENEQVYLRFDGVMMNATVDINGGKVALKHNGYVPFVVDITPYIYFGKENKVAVTVNPSMQPNSRWYTGAGIFRSVELVHTPKLHIANDGIYGYTKEIEFDENGAAARARLHTEVTIKNDTLENKMALVEVSLTKDGDDTAIISRFQKMQVNPNAEGTAYINLTLDKPELWDVDAPNLYRLCAKVTDLGVFKTHFVAVPGGSVDEASVLFGVKTVTADVNHGLRINGKTVKLKGGCLHHDNGMLGAVSLYDTEYRKLEVMKQIGFNAIRTSHNIPSSALLEACDRIGMYVFNEAFDAWGMMKQPGDYNMFFETDWESDLTAFMLRDRNHPSVVIWSTGNEITERGGLGNGYSLATKLAMKAKSLDPSRPISNAVCSYWSGLDDELTAENMRKLFGSFFSDSDSAPLQNADGGKDDTSWEEYSEAFTNGLDIVGYNYMEDKYALDHELYPDRVILGSENFPKEIGFRWPMVESMPYVLGDFTWTAVDYIGEAGIGKSVFLEENDPLLKIGSYALMSHSSQFPWRLANDADIDINGHILPQGTYRSVVWGDNSTYLYSYDPSVYGKKELISNWGFTDVKKNWNWKDAEGKPVQVAVFSNADKVELYQNSKLISECNAGERLAADLPKSFLFDITYTPGTLQAISYKSDKELSNDVLTTTDKACAIKLNAAKTSITADGHSVAYVDVELVDKDGMLVPDADISLTATVEGAGKLAAFGSANPITAENYTCGTFTSYRGRATAIIRSTYEAGTCKLKVTGEGLEAACLNIEIQ